MLPEFRCYNLRPPYVNSNFHYPQSPTEQDIQFQLFTNNNNEAAQILGAQDVSSVTSSDFDASGKVRLLTVCVCVCCDDRCVDSEDMISPLLGSINK